MASNIVIQFNNAGISGDSIEIQDSYTPNQSILFAFSEVQLVVNTVPVTNNIDSDINNVFNLINNSYNASNRYILEKDFVNKTITITDNIGYSEFTEENNNTSGRITTSGVNDAETIPINIQGLTITENSTGPCNLVDLLVNTNIDATQVTSPRLETVNSNSFTLEGVIRDSFNNITFTVTDGNTSTSRLLFIPFLNEANFDVDITQNPSGNTINIVNNYPINPSIGFTYSLDGISFTGSSSFSGLSEGIYTVYIKDTAGCQISKNFTIGEFEPNVYIRPEIFEISEQNSLIHVDRGGEFNNITNTLSYEELTEVNNQSFKQLYQNSDGNLTIQYKTTYESIDIKLVDCEGNESVIVPNQISQNIGITDVRDAKIDVYPYTGSFFVGVTYVSGKTYDPDTLTQDGSYYLANSVPSFVNIDDFIQIEGSGWYRVRDIVFIDSIQTVILDVTDSNFAPEAVGQTVRATSIYNQLDYELYEYTIDLSSLNGDYYIKYTATDSEFKTKEKVTEWFNVATEQYNTYLLQYYNSTNNETNYLNGLRNKLRLRYQKKLTYLPEDTNEVYLTDTNAVQTDAEYRDLFLLELLPVPVNMVRKIGLAVSNDRLFLNGLSLLKNSELEIERIGESNEYNVKIQFVRSNYVFDANVSDNSIVLPQGQPLQVNDNTEGLLFIN